MAVSKKLKAFYMSFFDGIETWTANRISDFQENRYLKRYIDKSKKLTKEQIKEVKEFWKPYKKVSAKWCRYYSVKNEKFDPRYIPNTLIYTDIDQHFNSRKLGYGFNDKNYYSKIFDGIKQPKTLVRNFGAGIFTDENYCQITAEQALTLILSADEVICKPSLESGSGRDIEFWNTSDKKEYISRYLEDKKNSDYIIQAVIKQHEELDKVHKGSVNTVRICSILLEDGVHILSSCLRMGVNKSRVDNVTAGGISCGILSDGTMEEYAYNYFTGERFDVHPQGYVFKGNKVPSYDKAVELVMKAHPMIGHFRLVSWDIAIDEQGEAVLIEANMRKGGINLHQFSNGPLFGDLTERVLNEVYNQKK